MTVAFRDVKHLSSDIREENKHNASLELNVKVNRIH